MHFDNGLSNLRPSSNSKEGSDDLHYSLGVLTERLINLILEKVKYDKMVLCFLSITILIAERMFT